MFDIRYIFKFVVFPVNIQIGVRTNAAALDFTDFLSEEMDHELKEAAQISMGTEVSRDQCAHFNRILY
jgi:hypothetical protein